jgi:hypothetical protein
MKAFETALHEIDQDCISTIPINKLAVLRAAARIALEARDAIDDCFSQAWRDAHEEAVVAWEHANAEMERLAKNSRTRYGSWRTSADVELMMLGYL